MQTFSISATTRSYPQLPYERMKDDILGNNYALSLAFVGATRAKEINKRTRNKSYVPNVLSFPLADDQGEIFITPVQAAKEAKSFGLSPRGYVGYLFIHGLLHLKGLDHGKKMDERERQYLKKYKLK